MKSKKRNNFELFAAAMGFYKLANPVLEEENGVINCYVDVMSIEFFKRRVSITKDVYDEIVENMKEGKI